MKALIFTLLGFSAVVSAKEPISSYLSRDHPSRAPTNDIRLAYVIVRLPMKAMADAIAGDMGDQPEYWQRKLDAWEKSGSVEVIEPTQPYDQIDLKNGLEWRQGYSSQPWRFIGVGAAATHWYHSNWARERGQPPPDQNELLQDLSEHSIGSQTTALAELCPDGLRVDLRLTLSYTPKKPDKRPTTTWPIPPFDASRLFFRSWTLAVKGRFLLLETVFLGAQMEPPHDGELHTGHVLAAFARIYPPKVESNASGALDDKTPGVRLQSWTLAVPRDEALPWLKGHAAGADDSPVFRGWLKRAVKDDGVELLATSAMSALSGGDFFAESKIEWEDVSGFEPAGTHKEFRPRPCDCGSYWLTYGTRGEMFAMSKEGEDEGTHSYWLIETNSERPAAATRWLKWKSAMERDEKDPNAVEIAEAGQAAERLHSEINVPASRVAMTGTALRGERVHVTFQRIIEDRATSPAAVAPKASVPLSPMLTLWMIETPLDWQKRLLTADRTALNKLGGELLDAAGKDDVRIVGQLSATHRVDGTRSCVFPGGDFVNTAPAPNGIFLNHRMVESEAVGDRMEIKLDDAGTRALQIHVTSIGEPEWRRWGIWQPGIKRRTAENSGIDRPVFARAEIDGRWIIEPGEVQVMAATRAAQPFAKKATEPRIRWYVARLDADHEANPGLNDNDGRVGRGLPSWQAAVLKVSDSAASREDSATAAELLSDAASGTVEVLELVTVHGGDVLKATAGSDVTFTEGRASKDILADKEIMPPGTRWQDQIDYNRRVVGFQFDGDVRDGTWKFTHDKQPPKIVTDTFRDAEIEWPDPLNWDVPRKIEYTTVNVQRPIFSALRSEFEAELPAAGEAIVKRVSNTEVLVLRRLK